jgi:Tfp pilus assembly protein PilO
MKLSPRITLILVAIGVLLVVVLAAAVLLFPQISRMTSVEGQMSSVDDQVTQAENLLNARQSAKDGAAFTDAALLELAAAVPENPDLPSLIIELQDRAYESDVVLTSIAPSDLAQESGYVVMPLEVQVTASWGNTVDFVQQLKKMERQLRIVSVETGVASPAEGEESSGDYGTETTLLIESYLIPSSESSASAPAPAAPTP